MAACVGATPPVTKRNGGLGSSSKLVRFTAPATVLVRGSMTDRVFESSLQMKTRSSPGAVAELVDWAHDSERDDASELTTTAPATIPRRVILMRPSHVLRSAGVSSGPRKRPACLFPCEFTCR